MEKNYIDFDQQTKTYTAKYDWGDRRTLSGAIVTVIADIKDVSPLDLEPLHGSVDPDALNQILTPTPEGDDRTSGHVSFVFESHHITVYGDGEVAISDISE